MLWTVSMCTTSIHSKFCKIVLWWMYKDTMDGLSVTNYFALVATLRFFYKLHIWQLGAEVNCCSEIVITLPVLKRKNQNTNHLFVWPIRALLTIIDCGMGQAGRSSDEASFPVWLGEVRLQNFTLRAESPVSSVQDEGVVYIGEQRYQVCTTVAP